MYSTTNYNDYPDIALKWYQKYGSAALATVVKTWGSAPRPAGSQLVIGLHGEMEGSVSGGCVEGAVIAEATEVVDSGQPKLIEFGVSSSEAFSVGLACGGNITILLEPIGKKFGIPVELLLNLKEARSQNLPAALCVNVKTWERMLVTDEHSPLGLLVKDRIISDRSGMEGDWFILVFNPPLRMIVVGGVHIAQPLLKMARLSGYEPILVDPRSAFATEERFPEQVIHTEWPDQVIPELKPDSRTAIVTLSHDSKIDDNALLVSFPTDAFYIGCLGSRKTHASRCKHLLEVGATESDIARIQAPVGLDIGASTPSEIAVAIMAQVTEKLRKPKAEVNSLVE